MQSRSLSPEDDPSANLLKEAQAFVKKWEGVDEDEESSAPIVPPTIIVQDPPKKEKTWKDHLWW